MSIEYNFVRKCFMCRPLPHGSVQLPPSAKKAVAKGQAFFAVLVVAKDRLVITLRLFYRDRVSFFLGKYGALTCQPLVASVEKCMKATQRLRTGDGGKACFLKIIPTHCAPFVFNICGVK